MPDGRRQRCKVRRGGCGRHADEAGPISWTGLCGDCYRRIYRAANDDLHYHRGPVFERWRRAVAASVGATLPDDG